MCENASASTSKSPGKIFSSLMSASRDHSRAKDADMLLWQKNENFGGKSDKGDGAGGREQCISLRFPAQLKPSPQRLQAMAGTF